MQRFARMVVLFYFIAWSSPVHAWGPAGHKLIAAIAFRQLLPARQIELCELLRHHPRFADDFQAKQPHGLTDHEKAEWLFQQASIWPDITRHLPEHLKQEYHHSTWHYCNRPIFLTEADRRAMQQHVKVNLSTEVPRDEKAREHMNACQAWKFSEAVLRDRLAPKSERALALCWVLHLTGDMHQPLHAVTLFSEDYFPSLAEGDRGGNLVLTKQGEHLHSLWDDFPGSELKFHTVVQRAVKFMEDESLRTIALTEAQSMTPDQWLEESYELARDEAYHTEVRAFIRQIDPGLAVDQRPKLVLSEEYLHRSGLIARQRVVTAGYRLGRLLR